MNSAEGISNILHILSQLFILMTAVAVYLTGRNMMRVWSEMRTELWELRGLTKKCAVDGSGETRAGAKSIDTAANARTDSAG